MPQRNSWVRRLLGAGLLALLCTAAWAGEVTVSAAASLTDAFRAMAADYQAKYPDATVRLNFGASGALLQQIVRGAPVDVFASADQATMDQAAEKGLLAERHDFTRNALVLIVPAASTLQLSQLQDLTAAAVQRITMGNPDVAPIGRYARRVLQSENLWQALTPKIVQAQNVRQALDYVVRGEVDAGFVFATDAALLPEKVKIALRVPLQEPILYPIGRITTAPNAAEAARFVAHVRSAAGQAILARHGFLAP